MWLVTSMAELQDTWYWDWRIDKAFYPVSADEETVTLVSVWHRDEVSGAIEHGAFDPVEEVGGENEGFDYFDSFRLPDAEDLPALEVDTDE